MEMHKSSIVRNIVITIAIFALSVCTAVESQDSQGDQRAVKTMATVEMFFLDGPSLQPDGNYSDLAATSEPWTCRALLHTGSDFTLSNVTIQWQIQTEFNTTVYAYGDELKFVYYNQGNFTINVTMSSNDGNRTETKHIALQVLSDFDHDGIPDWWEREYFGSTNTATNTSDYDNDGWTDLQEFERGTNPKVKNFKAGFLDEYWWAIVIIVIIAAMLVLYLFFYRPNQEKKRKTEEQKKIAAAVEIEKTLLGFDELEGKEKK